MVQSAGYKNPLSMSPFWQKATAEPPMEWTKQTAMMEMAVLAKNGIDVRTQLRAKPPIVESTELLY